MEVLNLLEKSAVYETDPKYKQFIDEHVDYFLSRSLFNTMELTGLQQGKYVGDFYGLLLDIKVPLSLHYLTLRCNRLLAPADWTGEAPIIIIPNDSEHRVLVEAFYTS